MAKIEIEIDDATGAPKDLPDALKPWQQRQFNEGFQKGSAKKAELAKDHDKAKQLREEQHQKDLETRDTAIKTRDEKLRIGVNAEIKAAALRVGARDESLDELIKLLGGEIHFDEKLDPIVKGADGKPAVDDKGQLLTIEGRVRQYLDKNRHHLKPAGGTGGGAGGGASFAHLTGDLRDLEERRVVLEKTVQTNASDSAALLELHEVNQKIAAKKKG